MVAIDWPVTEIVGTGPGLPCLAGNTYDPARCDLDACAARCALKSCYGKRECNSRDCRAGISERCRAELVERARESSAARVVESEPTISAVSDLPSIRGNGPRLQELRKARGWTQGELARRAGCAQSSVWHITRGDRIRGAILARIAAALGVGVAELMANTPADHGD